MSPPTYPAAFLAEDRRQPAIIGMVTVTVLSFIVVCVRLYARGYLIHELGRDDVAIVLAQLVSWIVLGLSSMVIQYGSGRHLAALMKTPDTLVHMYKWLVGAQLVYMFNLWLCRISGLAFYARLNNMPRFTLYLGISFVFVTAVYVAQTLIIALQCVPLAALWGGAEGKCIGSEAVFISTSGLTIACDLLILLLPMRIIFSLQAKLAIRIALAVVLCMGILTSILRMVSMIVALQNPEDATWYFSVVMAWSCTEISTAIIALSIPALRTLFGILEQNRSTKDQDDSNDTVSIGLRSIPWPAKRRVFEGSHVYATKTTAEVDPERNPSQEALWDTKDMHEIRIIDTVHVDYDRPRFI
ncbi:hypothetical protein N7457_004410 [Penicillium paradoxum]|uniref:uncharacterized protein n=1 Tax=Penicillium paradoxum TaxID=176176 RepID=UPI002548631A|nr:uncharacterized protein N7457_004410 [Penicillium paradoxum]KAJ5782636.1 hypothetical protein N7457_004410 [Penicillium paradoxum]